MEARERSRIGQSADARGWRYAVDRRGNIRALVAVIPTIVLLAGCTVSGGSVDLVDTITETRTVDLSDAESIKSAAATTGDTEIVINNAGVLATSSPLAEDAFESLAFEMDVNVYGLMRMARAFAPVLKANGGGVFAQLSD